MDPTLPTQPPRAGDRGIRRTLMTGALAFGVLTAGGTAVVLAASPDPGASAAPAVTDDAAGTTDGATLPSNERGPRGRDADRTKRDCPDGAAPSDDGASDGATGDDGVEDDATDEDATPTPEPTPDPTQTPTDAPSPTATPAV